MATAEDICFEVPQPAKHQVHCDLCRKDLPTPKALRWHLRVHWGKTHYICKKCGKHLASSHTYDMHKESCSSTEYTHNCLTFGKGYHTKQAMMKHLKSKHQPVPPVEDRTCPQCGEVFNLVKTMREHRAVHRDPFLCPVEDCPEIFSLPKHLNRHLQEKYGYDTHCHLTFGCLKTKGGHLKADVVTCRSFSVVTCYNQSSVYL